MLNQQWSAAKESALAGTDIVELISRTVALKKVGKDFVGLCPFHQERTPSFHVSPAKRMFYCFGCKVGGNAIDFLIKREGITFVEAMSRLRRGAWHSAPRAAEPVDQQSPAAPKRNDLHILAEQFRTAAHPDRLARFAADLQLGVQSLHRLDVGWAGNRFFCGKCQRRLPSWTFPMRRHPNTVCGIRLRFVPCHHKSSIAGGAEGLFVPREMGGEDRLFVCEGPSDTAALLDLELPAIGRASARGKPQPIVQYVKAHFIAHLIIVADDDGAGREGALQLAQAARPYCRDVRLITPPAGIKDARAWKQQGACAGDIEQLVAAAKPFKLVIKSQQQTNNSTSKEGIRL